jgi:hypothetical protein
MTEPDPEFAKDMLRGADESARKSVLLKWVEEQEGRHANDNCKPTEKTGKIGNG